MLPKPLQDKKIRFFKFWFNHRLQDGLHCQNELFYKLQTSEIAQRFQLYSLGGELAKQGADVLITTHPDHYSLWVSLRSHPRILKQLRQSVPLPQVSLASQNSRITSEFALAPAPYGGRCQEVSAICQKSRT